MIAEYCISILMTAFLSFLKIRKLVRFFFCITHLHETGPMIGTYLRILVLYVCDGDSRFGLPKHIKQSKHYN